MFIRRTQTRNTTSGETYHTRRLVRSAGVDGKVKRSDCPLVTLGLVLDGSGFVRRSEVFAGNVSEGQTLAGMLAGLNAPAGALVVMDRGIATEANRVWLREQGYRYLVVSRERSRQFDPKQATTLINAAGECLHLEKTLSEDATEVKLYGYSERRADKQTGIHTRFTQRFEAELDKIAAGLHKPRTTKRLDRLWERIGRLKAQSRGTCRSCGERCRTTASRRLLELALRHPLKESVECVSITQTRGCGVVLGRQCLLACELSLGGGTPEQTGRPLSFRRDDPKFDQTAGRFAVHDEQPRHDHENIPVRAAMLFQCAFQLALVEEDGVVALHLGALPRLERECQDQRR